MSDFIRIDRPTGPARPLVFDSPHSGSIYPADFDHAIDRMTLRRSEDAHIDDLFADATQHGVTLVQALFPRCYIDPNRNEDDIDLTMIDGDWSGPVNPSPKTRDRGIGLIWKEMKALGPIYVRKLTPDELRHRIETFWRPYHDALQHELDLMHETFGQVVHINCHSMASMGDRTTEDGPVARPDFVIGDRDGTACSPDLTRRVVDVLNGQGYRVAVNDPYKGYELVRRHGRPKDGRHSLQIEVNRALYMDEATLSKTENFPRLQADLMTLSGALADLRL